MSNYLPPEVIPHKTRLSPEALQWMEKNLERNLSLDKFTDKLFELIEQNEIIDAEIAYIACKTGVMTGKLNKVLNLGEAKHPAIQAYQALAHLFTNNFVKAEELLERAEQGAESINDVLVLAEIYGIKIYLSNARYQFFQGVKIIQKAFELLDKGKNRNIIDANPAFMQWIRISGSKSLLKLGNVPEALYTNKRALKLADDRFFKSMALLGIGHCYDLIGKTEEAVRYYKNALKQANEVHSYNIISIIYNRLGMALAWRMDKLQDGETYFAEAITSAERGESLWLKEGPQWNLIALYRARKDYNSAIVEVEEIVESARLIGDSRTELIALLNLGELLEEKGDIREATKVREAADSLASIIGIDIEEFYEEEEGEEVEDDEDEGDDEDDDEDEEEDDGEVFYDSSDDSEYDYYETDDSVFIDDNEGTDYIDQDKRKTSFQIDENLDENNPEASHGDFDDSDDILRKFFEKRRR